MKYWPIRLDKWNKMKVWRFGPGLALWDIAAYTAYTKKWLNEFIILQSNFSIADRFYL